MKNKNNHLKTYEEYKYVKIWPSKSNIKDPKEPFFNANKYDYHRQKQIFGEYPKHELIEIDSNVIKDIIDGRPSFGGKIDFVLNKIQKYCSEYEISKDVMTNYLVFEDLSDNDLIVLNKLGFGIYIYVDYTEFSDDVDDKYKIYWKWKS